MELVSFTISIKDKWRYSTSFEKKLHTILKGLTEGRTLIV